jgi:exosome complex RNA-binding protein Rrp42 (RNase PH superfamily)
VHHCFLFAAMFCHLGSYSIFEERDEERDDGRTMAQSRPLSSEQIAEDNADVRRSSDQHWLCSPQFRSSPSQPVLKRPFGSRVVRNWVTP